MLGGDDLGPHYPWIMRICITIHGQWMYPTEAVTRLVGLVCSGLLDLENDDVTVFEDANEAVANGGPFKMTVIQPRAALRPCMQTSMSNVRR
jgi:alcohol dehydrogenase